MSWKISSKDDLLAIKVTNIHNLLSSTENAYINSNNARSK